MNIKSKKKFFTLETLSKKTDLLKNEKKRIILCHGVFDVLHLGHIKHLIKAKSLGDVLVVSFTKNKFVDKGPNRPYFNLNQRMEAVAALTCVDFVTYNNLDSAVDVLKKIKPFIYCKGSDYKSLKDDVSKKIISEKKILEKYNGKLFFTNEDHYSSSKILSNYNLSLNNIQKKFIRNISSKKNLNIKKLFDKLKKQKMLILGEIIIDKYTYCEPLGKSGKDPIMMFAKGKDEIFLGGVGAIANHASQFSNNISLLAMIGDKNNYIEFIKKKISKKIKAFFYQKKNSSTIEKQKFLDKLTLNKVVGFYKFNDQIISSTEEEKVYNKIKNKLNKDSVILISDYGHGFISKNFSKKLSKLKNFTALNSQVNAANSGTHSVKKYFNIDLVIINETELRNELRDKEGDLKKLMTDIAFLNNFKILVVTRGKEGAILYNKKLKKFFICPAFAEKVVDKIGSGDAMLATIALAYKITKDEEISLLIGSLAAAQQVQFIGNKKSIDGSKLIKTFKHLINST